jgi:hypothetical protein
LTGSEIEAVFVEALYQSFDQDQEPTDLTIASVLTELVPLSKLMAEQISGLELGERQGEIGNFCLCRKGGRKMVV